MEIKQIFQKLTQVGREGMCTSIFPNNGISAHVEISISYQGVFKTGKYFHISYCPPRYELSGSWQM